MIVYKWLVLDRNTCNHITSYLKLYNYAKKIIIINPFASRVQQYTGIATMC